MRQLVLLIPAAGLAGIVGLLALAGGTGDATTTSAALTAIQEIEQQTMCLSTGPLTGLTDAQASNAEVIVAVANSASGGDPQAAQISLMTAITESGLNDDPGGMGGAVGLFQQTPPAWGTASQIAEPRVRGGRVRETAGQGAGLGRRCRRGRRRRRCSRRGRASPAAAAEPASRRSRRQLQVQLVGGRGRCSAWWTGPPRRRAAAAGPSGE